MNKITLETRWKACFKAILLVSPYVIFIAVVLVISGYSDKSNITLKFIVTFLIGLVVYFLVSLTGWLFIGMPISRIIEKYTSSSLLIYFGVSTFICLLIGLLDRQYFIYTIVVFGVPLVLQSVIYKYYLDLGNDT